MSVLLGDFVENAKPISANLPVSKVVELFLNAPETQCFILIRDKRPAGLIRRLLAFEFAASVETERLAQLPVGDLITAKAIIIKADTPVNDFVRKAGNQLDPILARGCIIVEDKRFKGVLSWTNCATR